MTPEERQSNFKIDLALAGLAILFAVCLGGCNAAPGEADTPSAASLAPRGTSPSSRDTEAYYRGEEQRAGEDAGTPILIDRATGCQYIQLYGNSLTPRMSRIENGKQYQVGCYVEDVVLTSPVPQ